MSSVINFFKKKIKPFKKCTGKPSFCFEESKTDKGESENAQKRVSIQANPKVIQSSNFKAKKRSKNMFNLKLKRHTNSESIQQYISSEIVIVSNDYTTLSNNIAREMILSEDITRIQITSQNETSASGCVSSYSKMDSNDSNFSSQYAQSFSNEWSNRSEHLINASSKNYYLNEACEETNFSNLNTDSLVTYNSKYTTDERNIFATPDLSVEQKAQACVSDLNLNSSLENFEKPTIMNSLSRIRQSKRKQINLENQITNQNLNRSLSINDELNEEFAKPIRANNASKRKCRRSNTTVANSNSKSKSIIDYFNKLELINPVRKKERKVLNITDELLNQQTINEIEKGSNSSLLNNTTNKNDMEKIQDLFFHDDDEEMTDEYSICFSKNTDVNMVLSSYMDSPVSSTGLSPLISDEKNENSFFDHIPSSSPASSEIDDKKTKSNVNNNSIEKIRRSISTPGLKDINASIFSNISNIQIKECIEVDLETDFNNNREIELNENSIDSNDLQDNKSGPQFIRGGKTRSSKNIKQLFKNVVKYQMNALNSLEKFYESQLNKLEADRKQNLKLNPIYADKINEFYDRQLTLLEERVQSNLTLICENKRNRLSTASSSSTIIASRNIDQLSYQTSANQYLIKSNNQSKFKNSDNMAKIVSYNHFKQVQSESDIKHKTNSRTLNDLKVNLKNQNNLLPSKNYSHNQANKFNDSNDVSADSDRKLSLPFQQLRRGDSENETEEYSVAKLRSPKISNLAPIYTNKFYKKQSILQSPQINNSFKNIETTKEIINKPQFQYQKNKVKRYSTSNENLAQITKVHHVKNNLARIVKLNKNEDLSNKNKILNSAFRNIKKHQSVCSLDSDTEYDFKPINLKLESIQQKTDQFDFQSINNQDIFNHFEINNQMQSRLSDSHLLFELRQQQNQLQHGELRRAYQKKNSKSFMIETKV